MKKVMISGNRGLSIELKEYLEEHHMTARCVDVFGDQWKNESFTGFDAFVHVAGVVPREGMESNDFYEVNTNKTREISEKAKSEGVPHFIFLSSMAVYGVAQQMNEKAGTVTYLTPCNPDSDYGKSKYLAEKAIMALSDNSFHAALLRIPSIYGKNRTEYLDQYRYLSDKLPFIPVCFTKLKKSVISVESLLEVIRLTIENETDGILCPDDGSYSAVDFCKAIHPTKHKSRLVGIAMEMFLKNNERIRDYYGAVCYAPELSNAFEGTYRKLSLEDGVRNAYEK